MRTKKSVSLIMAALFTVVTIAGSALAWEGYGKNGCGKAGRDGKGRMFHQWTQLTDDQRDQIQTLRQKFRDETADTRVALVSKKEQMDILMNTSSPDKAKLESLINEMSDLKKAMMTKKLDMALAVKKIAPELNVPMGHGMGFFERGGFGKMNKPCDRRGQGCRGMQAKCPKLMKKYGQRANCPALQTADETTENSETVTE